MLTSDYLDILPDSILDLFHEFEEEVIKDIARRLANLNFSSAAWQMQRLTESGALYEDVIKKLSKLTGKSKTELKRIFQKAGVKAIKFDDAVYTAVGLKPVPLNLSPAMARVMKAGFDLTAHMMINLTGTMAITAQNAFVEAADIAWLEVSTGAFDYNTAIRNAVIEVADKGIGVVNYASGKQDKVDVAMRRAVLTGVNRTVGQLQEERLKEMGVDLVETSAHVGARNKGEGPMNHESWQGRVFSYSGANPKYPDFIKTTGYGTGEGLCGWNCRHSFYPFFEGISQRAYDDATLQEYANKKVTYNGEELSFYDATQKQRAIERKIREWKRRAAALEAAGLDNSRETGKVKAWQAVMRDFIKQTGLNRQYIREQIL